MSPEVATALDSLRGLPVQREASEIGVLVHFPSIISLGKTTISSGLMLFLQCSSVLHPNHV